MSLLHRHIALVGLLLGVAGCSHGTFDEDRVYEHEADTLALDESGDATWTTTDSERSGVYFIHGQTGDVHTEWSDRDDVVFEVEGEDALMEMTLGADNVLVTTGRLWLRR